ncbi:MAG: 30S ribosomal protein S7 [Alphaproteobacteria bacterium]|nr:30S ribosomal protein S7 [Alphaproteobacteria bacterium]
MARRRRAERREVSPDPVYGDVVIARFINYLMWDGKKEVAESLFYGAFKSFLSQAEGVQDPAQAFAAIVETVRPSVEVRSRRVGGATYQVPVEVRAIRAEALALRWIVKAARSRKEKSMEKRLTSELLDAFSGRGNAVKKKDDVQRMADANRAFAHYRW